MVHATSNVQRLLHSTENIFSTNSYVSLVSGLNVINLLKYRLPNSSVSRLYKFDDNEVIECKMDNDEVSSLVYKNWLLMCIN